MSPGELGLVVFIVFAIVTARYWPRVGEWVVKRFGGSDADGER